MIDEQWAVFLAANRFLVGISIDGTKALHDELRQMLLEDPHGSRDKSTFSFAKK